MTERDTVLETAPAIGSFRVEVPQADLDDLRRRIAATLWPEQETVPDRSQGPQLAQLLELVQYWGTDYDWRKAEAQLNAFPQFMTTIDGVDVRSRHENALPLIITHGWPGSVFEQIRLTDPTAFGGRAEDAFDVVIPSLSGYGFSSKPTETGWGVERIGRAWDVLMKRLRTPVSAQTRASTSSNRIHGDVDQIVPMGAAAFASAKLVRNATLKVFESAPHGLAETHKDRLNADLVAFLQA